MDIKLSVHVQYYCTAIVGQANFVVDRECKKLNHIHKIEFGQKVNEIFTIMGVDTICKVCVWGGGLQLTTIVCKAIENVYPVVDK